MGLEKETGLRYRGANARSTQELIRRVELSAIKDLDLL